MKNHLPLILLLTLLLAGCINNSSASQRFVPVSSLPASQGATNIPWTGFFALDTETGQLCRTVEGKQFPDADHVNNEWINKLPLCVNLLPIAGKR